MLCDPVSVYQAAVARVPAYREFLLAQRGLIPEVHSREEFAALPLCDKKSYLACHPLEELCLDGSLAGKHVIVRSSGSTATPFYWPQMPDQERDAARWLYVELDEVLQVQSKPTLVVVALSLGSWISGELATWSLRSLAIEHENITLMTPGLDLAEVVNIIERFSPCFAQTLIYSYPPYARTLVDQALARGVPVDKLNLHFRMVGEGYSERYRDSLNRLLGYPYGDLSSMVSGYASTDFGRVGKETPVSVMIKRLLHERDLSGSVLGLSDIPTVCQFDASGFHLEAVDGELVITKLQAVPLVRYQTGDCGEVVEFAEMLERFRRLGVDVLEELERRGWPKDKTKPLPFVLVTGRKDGGISLFGANIPAALVRNVLESSPTISPELTANFQMSKAEDESGQPRFEILVEAQLDGQAHDTRALGLEMAAELARRSTEYAAVWSARGEDALPQITVVPRGRLLQGAKIVYVTAGSRSRETV